MKLRILAATYVAGFAIPPDAVAEVPPHLAAGLVAQGVADDHPDAVAYAETLAVPLPDGFADALAAMEPEAAARQPRSRILASKGDAAITARGVNVDG